MANGGKAYGGVFEQATYDLQCHFPVQAVDRLGCRVLGHGEDLLGSLIDLLTFLAKVKRNLPQAQNQADQQRPEQYKAKQLYRETVPALELQGIVIPFLMNCAVKSSCRHCPQQRKTPIGTLLSEPTPEYRQSFG